MNDAERAISLLGGDVTCVLVRGDERYISKETGVRLMMRFLAENVDLGGFSAADKIVGKAAAMLFALAKVAEVYGAVMSVAAVETFKKYGIRYSYSVLTEQIVNRRGDGACPMERAVSGAGTPEEAYAAIKNELQSMQNQAKAGG